MGDSVGIYLGILRTIKLDRNALISTIPANYVVNLILVAAAKIHSTKMKLKNNQIKIYNFAPDASNVLRWDAVFNFYLNYRFILPVSQAIWYPNCVCNTSETIHKLRKFFQHTIFAYLVDSVLFFIGKKPFVVEKYRKIHNLLDTLALFSMNSWMFETKNVEVLWAKLDDNDKKIFKFDMKAINWKEFFYSSLVGVRIFLLQDPLDTIPTARQRI